MVRQSPGVRQGLGWPGVTGAGVRSGPRSSRTGHSVERGEGYSMEQAWSDGQGSGLCSHRSSLSHCSGSWPRGGLWTVDFGRGMMPQGKQLGNGLW